jgi:hypothetical protein
MKTRKASMGRTRVIERKSQSLALLLDLPFLRD